MNLDFTSIDARIRGEMRRYGVPGMALAVVSGEETVYTGLFGVKDIETGVPPDARTRFACASITKSFTASALGILRDEGKLDWAEPVRRYLPGFSMRDTAAADVTLWDMLSHNTGLPRHDMSWYNYNQTDFPTAEYVARIAQQPPNKPFRTGYEYNNFMYAAAAYAAEQIAGMPFRDFLRTRIFEPLGMSDTTCELAGLRDAPNTAKPYKKQQDALVQAAYLNFDGMAGAGAINSTVADMAAWLAVNINGGAHKDVRILSEKTLAEIHTPRTVVPALPYGFVPQKPLAAYAFGWNAEPYRGRLALCHSGLTSGYSSYMTFMPAEKLGIVLLMNLHHSPFHFAAAAELFDHILGGGDGTDWFAFYEARKHAMLRPQMEQNARVESARRPEARPTRPLEAFAGLYRHAGYGALSVGLGADGLLLRYNGMSAVLRHSHDDTFDFVFAPDEPPNLLTASFHTPRGGETQTVAIPFEPSLTEPIVFERVSAPCGQSGK